MQWSKIEKQRDKTMLEAKIWLLCDVDLEFYEFSTTLELTFQIVQNLKRALWQRYFNV